MRGLESEGVIDRKTPDLAIGKGAGFSPLHRPLPRCGVAESARDGHANLSRGRVWEPSHGLDSKVRKAYVFDRLGDGIFDCRKGSVSLTVRQSFSKLMHGSLCVGDQRTRKVDKDAGEKIKRPPQGIRNSKR